METTDRINDMESAYREVSEAAKQLRAALTAFQQKEEKIAKLSAYYGSKEWFRDMKKDSDGNQQSAQQPGDFSEDAVWELINYNKELAVSLIKTGTWMLEHS